MSFQCTVREKDRLKQFYRPQVMTVFIRKMQEKMEIKTYWTGPFLLSISVFMVALWNMADHYIFAMFSSFFFSSPNLSRHRLDVCHTSTHGVALVRISDAGMKRAARSSLKYRTQKSRQKSPSGHHRTILSGYIFATNWACIDNRKKIVKQQYLLQTFPQLW